jgi:AraC-like DNA-binding protein
MRAKLEVLSNKDFHHNYLCYNVDTPAFDFYWHYHPEYELTFIEIGSGKRMIGDSFNNFTDGDLVLIGPNLPHTWVSNKKNQKIIQKARVLQFTNSFIAPLLQYPHFENIQLLLNKAAFGWYIKNANIQTITDLFSKINNNYQNEGLIGLLQLFQYLATLKGQQLCSTKYQITLGALSEKRVNEVFKYVQYNFSKTISLKKVAGIVYLSESAFCKFFKKTTGRTFSMYVNEVRIAHAYQLLIETDKSIASIASMSGFDSLTYFNRVFLKLKRVQPLKIRLAK